MHWLKGLFAAFIGGAANAFTATAIDPVAFNFGAEWRKTVTMALMSGVLMAAAYLKQSPLPDAGDALTVKDSWKPKEEGK